MKKFLVVYLLIMGLASCNSTRLRPSGNVVSENRNVGEFSSVSVESGLKLYIETASETSLKVAADDNLLPYILTYVSGDRLVVRVKEGVWFSGNATLNIYAKAPAFTSAAAAGGAHLIVNGTVEADDFNVALEGGSGMRGQLVLAGKLTADLAGGSNMDLTGSSAAMQLDLGGGSNFEGANFRSVTVDVNAAGGSNATVYASGSLNANAGGGSRIYYYGNPINTNLVSAGGSRIESRGN